jgi:signal transduction histidine kinase
MTEDAKAKAFTVFYDAAELAGSELSEQVQVVPDATWAKATAIVGEDGEPFLFTIDDEGNIVGPAHAEKVGMGIGNLRNDRAPRLIANSIIRARRRHES